MTTPADDRARILELLAKLDTEAFSWLALALLPSAMMHGAHAQVWPDGLGGFQDRATIEELRTVATRYVAGGN